MQLAKKSSTSDAAVPERESRSDARPLMRRSSSTP
jgi:hypothetical protein